ALLFNLLFDLARTSYVLRAQLARTAGLVVFSQALRNSTSGRHLSDSLLNGLLEASRYLTCELLAASKNAPATPTLLLLFRQLFDKLLFAHGMWLRAPIKPLGRKDAELPMVHLLEEVADSIEDFVLEGELLLDRCLLCVGEVQERLYAFLADEFRVDLLGQSGRSIVASALHAIKYYFWIVKPTEPLLESTPECSQYRSAAPTEGDAFSLSTQKLNIVRILARGKDERPPLDCLARIRSNLLLFIKPLILQQYQFSSTAVGNPFPPQGEEVDSLFNFLSTVKE
ncbi:hypothetical protein ACTXT7_016910, partial [Hymenolepis weldensis]